MKVLQALLLGTAAAMLVIGAAGAGERQVKAKPADRATNCSAYGPGFRYVPGADACVKVGGWVRA
ncbi:MAG: porin, partial [Xanthobacteraceae bacterium]